MTRLDAGGIFSNAFFLIHNRHKIVGGWVIVDDAPSFEFHSPTNEKAQIEMTAESDGSISLRLENPWAYIGLKVDEGGPRVHLEGINRSSIALGAVQMYSYFDKDGKLIPDATTEKLWSRPLSCHCRGRHNETSYRHRRSRSNRNESG